MDIELFFVPLRVLGLISITLSIWMAYNLLRGRY